MSDDHRFYARQTAAAIAATTFNSDRAAIEHLQTAAHGRRAGARTMTAIADDLLGALTGREPGRHAATHQEDR